MPIWMLCASLALSVSPATPAATPESRAPRTDAYGDPLPAGAVARLGTSRWRTDIPFSQLAFSADGTIVAGNNGAEIVLWQFPSGKLIRRYPGPGITSRNELMTFSPDKRFLIIRTDLGGVPQRFDLATGETAPLFKTMPGWVMSTLSADGKTAIWNRLDRGIASAYLVDAADPSRRRELVSGIPGNRGVVPFLSPDGHTAAIIVNRPPTGNPADSLSEVTFIDVSTSRALNFPLPSQVTASQVRFNTEGTKAIATTTTGPYLFEFVRGDKPGWKAVGAVVSPDDPFAGMLATMLNDRIVFTSDGKYLITSTAGLGVIKWDLRTHKNTSLICSANNAGGFCLALSPDGKTLITSNDTTPGLHLWDLATGKDLLLCGGHTGAVSSLLFATSGKALISEGGEAEILSWDLQPVRHCVAQPGERTITEDRYSSRPWNSLSNRPNDLSLVQFPPEGRAVYAYSASAARFYRFPFDGNRQPTPISDADEDIEQCLVSPNGKTMVIGHSQGGIKLFDIASGSPSKVQIVMHEVVGQMFFTPDGKTLAMRDIGSPRLRFWDLTNSKELARPLAEATGNGKGVRDRYWCSFGQLHPNIDNVEMPPIRRIWDRTTGRLVREFDNLEGVIALSHSGSLMAWVPANKTTAPDVVTERPKDTDAFEGGLENTQIALLEAQTADVIAEVERLRNGGDGVVNNDIALLETATGKEIYRFYTKKPRKVAVNAPRANPKSPPGPAMNPSSSSFQDNQSRVTSLEFSPDGKLLAAGYADGTILLWDCTPPRLKTIPTNAEMAAAWKRLNKPSSEEVYRAMGTLLSAPSSAIEMLRREMKLPQPIDALIVHQLLNDLDHRRYVVREKATNKLAEFAPYLEEKLLAEASHVSLEASTRIMRVLDAMCRSDADSETLRLLRVVMILEQINTTNGDALLQKLAGSQGPASRAARDALARK